MWKYWLQNGGHLVLGSECDSILCRANIILENYVDVVVVDDLSHCITRPPATKKLIL